MAALTARGARLTTSPRLILRAALLVGAPALVTAVLLMLPWGAFDAATADTAGSRITDRSGTLLSLMPGKGGAFQIRLSKAEVPEACAAMFVQLEDRRFRSHPGVDPVAIARAIIDRVFGRGARSGASTITMQLARLLSPHVPGILGKPIEIVDALRIESRLTKDRILSSYLNLLPFGRNVVGVGAAAWTYFGTDVSSLSREQLLALAIIPRNPTAYDPFDHAGTLIAAARDVNARLGLGLPPDRIETAVRGAKSGRPEGIAPHFARYVARLVAEGRVVPSDGIVRTTLDLGLNKAVEARVRFILARYSSARVTNAAVVVIDNATGGVLAWVGSRDFGDTEHSGQIDGVLIRRQSASTLKPFLYADALETGWTAATLLPDVPIAFSSPDEESYRPENYDKRSHGIVRLRTALASSLNVPAVYALSRVGLERFFTTLRTLGFAVPADAASRYGMGAAVGNAEVSLLELAHAFSVFPRGGTIGDVVVQEGRKAGVVRVFDPFSAWIICNILSDASARVTGFGTRTFFRTPFPTMFKSGTSSEFTNLWCLGATRQFTVGVWAGNFDGRAVINKTGSIVPTQILTDVLTRLAQLHPAAPLARDFARPAGVVEARICTATGESATAGCGATRVEYFRSIGEVPRPAQAGSGPQSLDRLLYQGFLDAAHPLRILFPVQGQVFYLDRTVSPSLQEIPLVLAVAPRESVTVTMDGAEIARATSSSAVTIPLTWGQHWITLTGRDGSVRVSFIVR